MIKHATIEAGELIGILNPKIMGWGNFYRHAAAKKTFSYADNRIFRLLYRWVLRRHPNKSKSWVVDKYFSQCDKNTGHWNFFGYTAVGEQKVKIFLSEMASIPIKRHIKIRGDANPYDPAYDEYFKKRREKKTPRNHWHDLSDAHIFFKEYIRFIFEQK